MRIERRLALAFTPVLLLAMLVVAYVPARAQQRITIVATFSILADFVRNVGGDRVNVVTLVGPNSDAHVYAPTPHDARSIADARVVVANGLGFEGWIARLVKASGGKATMVVASAGVRARRADDGLGHAHDRDTDPHAWQSVANAKIYVANIRDALSRADPAGRDVYAANAAAYLARLDALEKDVRDTLAAIPAVRRKVITSHDAFGYFKDAYGIDFIAPRGVSTEAQASARDVARIIGQIRKDKIPAVFLENVTDQRLLDQIARETGARIGGTLYSDALTGADGQAPTYIDMILHNVRQLAVALVG
ncbi:MAG: zinc ABC transporter substrate-binding protein [Proteobacteria bacterium]|nr:zinc ABC transporter substrate-binding protein [Pseudomonadota bacterium]